MWEDIEGNIDCIYTRESCDAPLHLNILFIPNSHQRGHSPSFAIKVYDMINCTEFSSLNAIP